jgi:Skp family chaperone for outer membrane proteins
MRLLIIGLLILAGPTIYGQTKQGYIDFERVVVTFPQYSIGQKEIEKRTNQLTDSLRMIGDKIQNLVRGEYPRNLTSDSSFRKEMENKLLRIQIEMGDFQSYAKEQLKKLRDRIDNNLLGLVSDELKEFSTDNDLICVLDKKSILYCNDCKDFTDDFIHYYKGKRK